mmetsp:Transcript_7392/g.27048  ORF Transcript_7392/g.27048 Transcript_7392/m.27048 type:complete len:379 (-) Transcript_7392:92-1228(-)
MATMVVIDLASSASSDSDHELDADSNGSAAADALAKPEWAAGTQAAKRRRCHHVQAGRSSGAAGEPAVRALPSEPDEAFARRLQLQEDALSQQRLAPAAAASFSSSSSDVARALGVSRFAQPLNLWRQRTLAHQSVDLEVPVASTAGSSSSASATHRGAVERLAKLPPNLLVESAPAVDVCGTPFEPLLFVRNVDRCRGRLIAGRVLDDLISQGRSPPMPRRRARGGIVAEWHRVKRSPTPWRTGVRALSDLAAELLAVLQADTALVRRCPALLHSRPWNDSEVLVTTPGCTLGRHTDAQPEGSLLFIFCAGLSCKSLAWPAGRLVERTLESGDVMIMDGKRTAHAISAVLGDTSPMPQCPWLGQRRLSVLVRQCPAP